MRRLGAIAGAVLLVVGIGVVAQPATAARVRQVVLSAEGNHLWAYDSLNGKHQLVSRARNGGNPGAKSPNGIRRDINGQICISPDRTHIITGEDTVNPGGSSHDPRIAGWGWFTIEGTGIGNITIEQTGKLAPEGGDGPGYTGDPDNYGCGFLDNNRLFTTAIGHTLPGQPANGQLFMWFGPFEDGFQAEPGGIFTGRVDHCEIDHTLATAGGIAVDPTNGDVYVAANRPTEIPGGDPSAVWRYRGRWPTSPAECTREYLRSNIRKQRVLPALDLSSPAPPLPADLHAVTPSAVAITPQGTLLVSSVFTGTVAEFTKGGRWIRDVYPISPISPPIPPVGQTPFGIALGADGALWIADLGIVIAQPAPGLGSLIRVRFDSNGNPRWFGRTIRDGLTFPDGVGIYTPPT